jgi:hypothetical protein
MNERVGVGGTYGIMMIGENRSVRRKTCPTATLSTTKSHIADPGSTSTLRGEWLATNRLTSFREVGRFLSSVILASCMNFSSQSASGIKSYIILKKLLMFLNISHFEGNWYKFTVLNFVEICYVYWVLSSASRRNDVSSVTDGFRIWVSKRTSNVSKLGAFQELHDISVTRISSVVGN